MIYEVDPKILKMYLPTKNEFSRSRLSTEHYRDRNRERGEGEKNRYRHCRQTDMQTGRCDRNHAAFADGNNKVKSTVYFYIL